MWYNTVCYTTGYLIRYPNGITHFILSTTDKTFEVEVMFMLWLSWGFENFQAIFGILFFFLVLLGKDIQSTNNLSNVDWRYKESNVFV